MLLEEGPHYYLATMVDSVTVVSLGGGRTVTLVGWTIIGIPAWKSMEIPRQMSPLPLLFLKSS